MRKRFLLIILGIMLLAATSCTNRPAALTATELLDLGERYLLELNFEQALVQFLQVIEVEPMNPRGYTGAAEAHLALGQLDEAIAILKQGYDLTGNSDVFQMLYDLQESIGASERGSDEEFRVAENTASLHEIPYGLVSGDNDFTELFLQMAVDFRAGDRDAVKHLMQNDYLINFLFYK